MTQAKPLNDMVETAVDRVATKAEEIHRAVGAAPITMLERLGLLAESADDLREVHNDAVGVVYDLVRDINHSVHDLSKDLTEDLKTTFEELDSAEA
jgi:hypothetical protein